MEFIEQYISASVEGTMKFKLIAKTRKIDADFRRFNYLDTDSVVCDHPCHAEKDDDSYINVENHKTFHEGIIEHLKAFHSNEVTDFSDMS